MGDDFRMIIDAGGLPDAAPYYKFFPHEPSPQGEMTLDTKTTAAVKPITMTVLMDQMLKVNPGGTVLLVCHGTPGGFLIPLAGGQLPLNAQDALTLIMAVAVTEGKVDKIRQMPEKTVDEQKAKRDALVDALKDADNPPDFLPDVSLKEAQAGYDAWIANEARRASITAPQLRELIKKMNAVRDLKLKRVEIRACDVGSNKKAMEVMRKFFGCAKLTAPKSPTFFLPKLPPQAHGVFISILWAERTADVKIGTDGREWKPPGRGQRGPPKTFVLGKRRRIDPGMDVIIWEFQAFHYRWTIGSPQNYDSKSSRADPNWAKVVIFISKCVMKNSSYTKGPFPLAGFWRPAAGGVPFVLPLEDAYNKNIETVP